MPTALAHFQCRFHSILDQVVLELQQVLHGVFVVGIDRNPFTTLGGRIDGIQPDGDFAFQMLAYGTVRQHERHIGSFLAWPEVIVAAQSQGAGEATARCRRDDSQTVLSSW